MIDIDKLTSKNSDIVINGVDNKKHHVEMHLWHIDDHRFAFTWRKHDQKYYDLIFIRIYEDYFYWTRSHMDCLRDLDLNKYNDHLEYIPTQTILREIHNFLANKALKEFVFDN